MNVNEPDTIARVCWADTASQDAAVQTSCQQAIQRISSTLDPTFAYRICARGSLYGFAQAVLRVCDRVIEL